MFTMSTPFWYRPATGGGDPVFEETFIFDDIKTGSATAPENWTTQYPTLTVTSSSPGGFVKIFNPRPSFAIPPTNYPTPGQPVQVVMASDGADPALLDITFQRDYVHLRMDYLDDWSFTIRFYDSSNTEILVAPITGTAGTPGYPVFAQNMPMVGPSQLKFRRMTIRTMEQAACFDNIYVKSIAA